jgi:hypothetical protein
MSTDARFYTYIYYDPRIYPPIPFYVGKGVDNRMYSHLRDAKNNVRHPKVSKIKAIWNAGLEPIIEKIDDNLTEETSLELEDFVASLIGSDFVKEYKNGPLTNMVECGKFGGGMSGELNGMYGKTHSDNAKQIMSKINKNKVNVIDIISGKHKKVFVDEWAFDDNLVAESKGRTWIGKPATQEAIENMCIAQQKYHKENPRKWMTKNKVNKMIKITEIKKYLSTGWALGRYNNFKISTKIDIEWLKNELKSKNIPQISKESGYSINILWKHAKTNNLEVYKGTRYNLFHKDLGILYYNLTGGELCKISQVLKKCTKEHYFGKSKSSKSELKKKYSLHLVGLYTEISKI